jgi:hypothetical protein
MPIDAKGPERLAGDASNPVGCRTRGAPPTGAITTILATRQNTIRQRRYEMSVLKQLLKSEASIQSAMSAIARNPCATPKES